MSPDSASVPTIELRRPAAYFDHRLAGARFAATQAEYSRN
jgi:hypothetical protein